MKSPRPSVHPAAFRPRVLACAAVASLAALCATQLAGCNILGPVAYAVHGPPKVDAQHNLDAKRTHVVFVDDPANRAPRRSLRLAISEATERTLIAEKVLPAAQVLPSQAALQISSRDRNSNRQSVVEIGRGVGAAIVIHVELEQFWISTNGVTLAPRAAARVKVIDAENNARIWPASGPGFPLVQELPPRGEVPATQAERAEVERALAAATDVAAARLFFKHAPDALSGKLHD